MKNRNNIPFPIGGASLIMTFFMLCLSVFGIIAYMSAQRDYNLSLKTAENVSAYYRLLPEHFSLLLLTNH